jgi:uncharacterized protein YuzE
LKEELKIKYSPDADAIVIIVRAGRPAYGDEMAPGVIMHYNKKNQLVEIEILDASELVSAAVREMAKTTREVLVQAKSKT